MRSGSLNSLNYYIPIFILGVPIEFEIFTSKVCTASFTNIDFTDDISADWFIQNLR